MQKPKWPTYAAHDWPTYADYAWPTYAAHGRTTYADYEWPSLTRLLTVLVVVSPLPAHAYGSVDAYVYFGSGLNIATWVEGYDTDWQMRYNGSVNLVYTNPNPADLSLGTKGFCTEVQIVYVGSQYHYSVLDAADVPVPDGPMPTSGPMGEGKAALLSELWGRFYSNTTTDLASAAFGLASLEIIHELPGTALTTLSGNFKARADTGNPATAIALADNWLSQLDGTGPRYDLCGLSSPTVQDFITEAPEPGSLLALASGLAGLSSLAARRRRK